MLDVIEAYAAKATTLIDRYSLVSSRDLFEPVCDLLPSAGSRVVDVGAGPGRDAAWLASMGHTVLAVEPVEAFRDAGVAICNTSQIEWLDDRLPLLVETQRHGTFALVLVCAVWHHLGEAQHAVAMSSLAKLTAPAGLLIMSLRHGPGAPDRAVFPTNPDDTIAQAENEGLTLLRRVGAQSVQPLNNANGVTWTWLVFTA